MFSDITKIGSHCEKCETADQVQNGLYLLGKVEHDGIIANITACGHLPENRTNGRLWIFLYNLKSKEIRVIQITVPKKKSSCATKRSFKDDQHPKKDDLIAIYIHRNLSINDRYIPQVGITNRKQTASIIMLL